MNDDEIKAMENARITVFDVLTDNTHTFTSNVEIGACIAIHLDRIATALEHIVYLKERT